MIGLFFGVDLYSVTIIVAAYMAGLGLGNLGGGYIADRLPKRGNILVFAVAELYIGLFALLSKGVFYDFLFVRQQSLGLAPWVMTTLLFLALLCPTFAMGVSLPCLSRALTAMRYQAAQRISLLYGINTFGASVGALVTTLLLFRIMPMETILIIGATLNIFVSASSLLLVRFVSDTKQAEHEMASPPMWKPTKEPGISFAHWVWLSAFSGFIGLSLEIVWFRILGITLKNTSFTFGILLGIYLSALGIGNILGAKFAPRSDTPARRYLELQVGTILYVALFVILFMFVLHDKGPLSPLWLYFRSFESNRIITPYIQFVVYILFPVAFIFPPAVCMGMSFSYLQKSVHEDLIHLGSRVGIIQAANIGGSITGVIVTSLVCFSRIGTPGTIRMLLVLGGLPLFLWGVLAIPHGRRIAVFSGLFLMLLTIGAFIPDSAEFWSKLHGVSDGELVTLAEDGTGVTILRTDKTPQGIRTAVIAGGRDASWIPFGGAHTLLGVLPVLVHPNPKEIAVIGLGSGDTLFHIGGSGQTEHITSIEIVSSELAALHKLRSPTGYPALMSVLSDPRISYINADARTWLMRTHKKYDVIEADALWPDAAYSGNLYSTEYFTLLKNSLNEGGIALTWSPTQRTLNTFIKVFPYVFTVGAFAIGSSEPINFDTTAVSQQFRQQFTQQYYTQSGLDVLNFVESYINVNSIDMYGSDFDRSAIYDVNYDLYPKDEFAAFSF